MSHVVLGSKEDLPQALASALGAEVVDLDAPLPRGTTGVVIVLGPDPGSEPSTTAQSTAPSGRVLPRNR